eukprot:544681-Prymnesium_polylepis.1
MGRGQRVLLFTCGRFRARERDVCSQCGTHRSAVVQEVSLTRKLNRSAVNLESAAADVGAVVGED